MTVHLYCDGGVQGPNPSTRGGTWCYCHVNPAIDARVAWKAGIVRPADIGLPTITNNLTELLAAIEALESVSEGWAGILHTDSNVTRIRLEHDKAKMNGIPLALQERLLRARRRVGAFTVVLLGGHPTKADLKAGRRKRDGMLVSAHNAFCDQECSRLAKG